MRYERFLVGKIDLDAGSDRVVAQVVDGESGVEASDVYDVVFERSGKCALEGDVAMDSEHLCPSVRSDAVRVAGGAVQMERCRGASKPHFAPISGICWNCRADMVAKQAVEFAFGHVTGCATCGQSFVE